MTKQEVESYIAVHGNARQVIDTLKAMNAEGINIATITEAQLTERINRDLISELDYGIHTGSYESGHQTHNQPVVYDNPNRLNSVNINNQYSAPVGRRNTINKHVFVWVCCFLLGWLGLDRFMRGQIGLGIFKLLLGTWLTLGIWPLVDWIIAMVKAYGNAYGSYDDITFINGGYIH